ELALEASDDPFALRIQRMEELGMRANDDPESLRSECGDDFRPVRLPDVASPPPRCDENSRVRRPLPRVGGVDADDPVELVVADLEQLWLRQSSLTPERPELCDVVWTRAQEGVVVVEGACAVRGVGAVERVEDVGGGLDRRNGDLKLPEVGHGDSEDLGVELLEEAGQLLVDVERLQAGWQ